MQPWRIASVEYCMMCLPSAGAIYTVMENCVALEYCKMCLPSARPTTSSHEEPPHWNTAEYVYLLSEQYIIDMENCVTGILQNVSLK